MAQVSQSSVSEWFSKGAVPTVDAIVRLGIELRVSLEWLLLGRGERQPGESWSGEKLYTHGGRAALAEAEQLLGRLREEWSANPRARGEAALADERRLAPKGARRRVRRKSS